MSKDVEMKPLDDEKKKVDTESKDKDKDGKDKDGKDSKDSKEEEKKPEPPTPLAEIKTNVALIERAVSTLEPRFSLRVLRRLAALRKKIDEGVLRSAVEEIWVKGHFYLCISYDFVRIF
jgi:26S proteasome regulatory subunit N3